MLRVTLLGNLGGDPDLRFTAKGTQAVVLRVAVNQIRRGPEGERQENTEWFRVHVTGPKTEYAQRFVKGNRVLVVGRLVIGHYTSKDGEPRTSFDVWADELEGMSPRPRDADSAMEAEAEPAEPVAVGVSSLGSADVTRGARGGRAGNGPKSAAQEVEDLPF